MDDNRKVVVGLSGGVDSAVAAYLLREQGYEVIGLNIQVYCDRENEYAIRQMEDNLKDAGRVAQALGIEFVSANVCNEFEHCVVEHFVNSYNNGRTPNPCVICNRDIKWSTLIKVADSLGAGYVATGHYAAIVKKDSQQITFCSTKSKHKNQTYSLINLSQEMMARTIFPLSHYDKQEVRSIARTLGLPVADKKDSQDICFIPDGKYANFIRRRTGKRAVPGNIIDGKGNVIGRHKGIIFYTVGQHKGLNLDVGRRLYVKEIKPQTNEIVAEFEEELFSSELIITKPNYFLVEKVEEPIRGKAQIRYGKDCADCTVTAKSEGLLKCTFDYPQRAITPGQTIVVYNDRDEVILGGEIL